MRVLEPFLRKTLGPFIRRMLKTFDFEKVGAIPREGVGARTLEPLNEGYIPSDMEQWLQRYPEAVPS